MPKTIEELEKEVAELKEKLASLEKFVNKNRDRGPMYWFYRTEDVLAMLGITQKQLANCRQQGLIHDMKIPSPLMRHGYVIRYPHAELMQFFENLEKIEDFNVEYWAGERAKRLWKYNIKTKKLVDVGPAPKAVVEQRQEKLAGLRRRQEYVRNEKLKAKMEESLLSGEPQDHLQEREIDDSEWRN